MNKQLLIIIVTLPLSLLGASSAFASANAKKEISTAYTSSVTASKASTINQAHKHLQQIVNCLVGSKGVGFDASAGDPCMGMGNGAITDFNYKKADKLRREKVEEALESVNYGLLTKRINIAHNAAELAAKDLKQAQENL